ncbi:MAG: helix-turn-helix transcriptional regulator, partial [Chloroflexota bacterium]
MANRTSKQAEATSRARRLKAELGAELREARLGRGIRLVDVARSVGLSASHISRLERGLTPDLSVLHLARHGAVVGLRLHARFYPAGGGLRDAAQLDLLRHLRA